MTGFSRPVCACIDGRSGGVCEVCGNGRAVERHHRRPRGMGGSSEARTNSAANALHVCGVCHRLIEANRTLALLLGWLLPQSADPAASRVMYRGEWTLLGESGDVTNGSADDSHIPASQVVG